MISLTVFIACLTTAHASCSCKPFETVKEAFCQSDYVLLGRVLSINTVNAGNATAVGAWNYNIWHMWTWKGPIVPTSALTAPNSGTCGVSGVLLKNWDYFLTGKKGKNGEITFTSCDFVMPYYEIAPEEMHVLMKLRDEPKKCKQEDDEKGLEEDENGKKGEHVGEVEENGGIIEENDEYIEDYDDSDWEGNNAMAEYDDEEESREIIIEEYDDKGLEEYDERA
ncbi:hypothetical protein Aduo_010368 [Ancylostoma duodenale]